MSLRKDCSGLESLPLKLIVVAVVASLSVIPAAQALEVLRTREFEREAALQLAAIVSCAEVLSLRGPGNVRTIPVDLRGGGGACFSSLTIGDTRSGTNASSIVLETSGGHRMIRMADRPPVWLCSVEGTALVVCAPVFGLRMSVPLTGESACVLVEVR